MGQAKKKEPTPLELLKLEIARELGLEAKVENGGWGGLSSRESGRVGGILQKRLRELGLHIGPKGTLINRKS